jgi:hypothetical protein
MRPVPAPKASPAAIQRGATAAKQRTIMVKIAGAT